MSVEYGLGQTNIDLATGIRYGVIPAHDVGDAWYESAESDYGDPSCPICGNEAQDASSVADEDFPTGRYHDRASSLEYVCWTCDMAYSSEDVYGDEPTGYSLDDGQYSAVQDADGDIFITRSPYFTYAPFCSPCAPGAVWLREGRTEDRESPFQLPRGYAFGHEWFEDDVAPYPIYSVETGELIAAPVRDDAE